MSDMLTSRLSGQPLALEARNIFKWFPGGFANDMVDFELRRGEIHAILGENGAGKSTLMNIIYGLLAPDGGEILVNGREVKLHDPREAIKHKIGMVHQQFMLIPVFTVLENIVLGDEDTRGPFLNMNTAREKVIGLSQLYGVEVDPDALVADLPAWMQQRVEILKALYRGAEILVFDEPTGVLTPQEAKSLFQVMRDLRDHGIAIIFITHKIREVLEVADRITVMRRGKVVRTTSPGLSDQTELAELMVGRATLSRVVKQEVKPGAPVLAVKHLLVTSNENVVAVNNVSFTVRAKEIVGIAGVQGNGQVELIEALMGLRPIVGGQIDLMGRDVSKASPRTITELGTAYVPSERQRDGLVLSFPVAQNLTLTSYYKEPFSRGAVLQEQVIAKRAAQLVQDFDIQTAGIDGEVEFLTSGDQQKVIIAREFSRPIRLLVASQPTRGLDADSIEYVHRRLIDKRNEGSAILLVSTELDEILSLSDRILVMYRGLFVAEIAAKDATREQLGLLMAGVTPEPAFFD